MDKLNNPIYTHKGKNHLRYLSITLLVTIIGISIYAIQIVGFVMIIVILFAVFGLLTIRFSFIHLFPDHFIVERKCLLKKFNDLNIYSYDEIKEIKYVPGYTKWGQMIIQSLLGQGAYGGFSKPDQIRLKLNKTEKIEIIYRFGNRKEFTFVANMIKEHVDKAQHLTAPWHNSGF